MRYRTTAPVAIAMVITGSAAASSISMLDTGAGRWETDASYTAVDSAWFAAARTLDAGPGSWAIATGNDPIDGGRTDANVRWSNGSTFGFDLAYDGDVMSLTISSGTSVLSSVSHDIEATTFDTLMIQLDARDSSVAATSIASMANLSWTDESGTTALPGSFFASNLSGSNKVWGAFGGSDNLADSSWSLSGDVSFMWLGLEPTNDLSGFEIQGVQLQVIPLPAPMLMAGVGLLAAAGVRRRILGG